VKRFSEKTLVTTNIEGVFEMIQPDRTRFSVIRHADLPLLENLPLVTTSGTSPCHALVHIAQRYAAHYPVFAKIAPERFMAVPIEAGLENEVVLICAVWFAPHISGWRCITHAPIRAGKSAACPLFAAEADAQDRFAAATVPADQDTAITVTASDDIGHGGCVAECENVHRQAFRSGGRRRVTAMLFKIFSGGCQCVSGSVPDVTSSRNC
jgi:hypothetical protein